MIFLIFLSVKISLIFSHKIHSSEKLHKATPFSINGIHPANSGESANPTHFIKFAPLSVSISTDKNSAFLNRLSKSIDSLKFGWILYSRFGIDLKSLNSDF